jgi:hypothetical protein
MESIPPARAGLRLGKTMDCKRFATFLTSWESVADVNAARAIRLLQELQHQRMILKVRFHRVFVMKFRKTSANCFSRSGMLVLRYSSLGVSKDQ